MLDLFTEVRLPLVQDAPFADQLGMELAYRYSDYDPLTTDTYKVGLDWAPIQDVRFRGSYQRAIRAPNVVELFTAQGFNLFDLPGDPCGCGPEHGNAQATTGLDSACLAELRRACAADGVPAANVGRECWTARLASTTSCRAAIQDLVPEESDTYTYGVVLQPSFLPKLAMSIDYFDIEIEDAISTRGADSTLQGCFLGVTQSPATCIQRNDERLAVARRRPRDRPQHQHRWLDDEGLGPQRELYRCRAGIVRRVELQPGRHGAG